MKVNQELLIKYMNQPTFDDIHCMSYCIHLDKSEKNKYGCNLFLVFSKLKYEYNKETHKTKIIRCIECLESFENNEVIE